MARRRTSKFKKLIFGLLALTFGGGTSLWGWFDPDVPVVGSALQKLREGLGGTPASPLLAILPQKDSFTTAGTFEVTIAKVSIDPAELRSGRHIDMQLKLSKKQFSGQQTLLWDSRFAGDRNITVGREPVTASWSDKPFLVQWQPGEDFVIEVWDRNSLFDKTFFLFDTSNGDREFPLRSDTFTMMHFANGRRASNPSLNSVRVESKRAADAAKKGPS